MGGNHYKGHWKRWALKIETFTGPENEIAQRETIPR
jgi:hypothetical protein